MKAKEFRLGNLISVLGNVVEVIKIYGDRKIEVHSDILQFWDVDIEEDDMDVLPIPLTEEWLLKLDFTSLDLNGWQFGLNISALPLLARQNFGHWYFELGGIYLGDIIKHVHTLQNFCSVFGKELEVKS